MSKILSTLLLSLSLLASLPVKAQENKVVYVWVRRDKGKSNYSRETQLENLDYSSQISYYCSIYGCNSSQLYRVMMCESKGNPSAYNPSGASGLFQFMPQTWNYFSRQAGFYGNIWNASDQIKLASWSFANGLSYHWVCK